VSFGIGGDFQSSSRERVPSAPLALLGRASAERLWQGKPLHGPSPVWPCARIRSLYRGNVGSWDSHHFSEGFEHNIKDFPKPRQGCELCSMSATSRRTRRPK
jgi:hypothetical protein